MTGRSIDRREPATICVRTFKRKDVVCGPDHRPPSRNEADQARVEPAVDLSLKVNNVRVQTPDSPSDDHRRSRPCKGAAGIETEAGIGRGAPPRLREPPPQCNRAG